MSLVCLKGSDLFVLPKIVVSDEKLVKMTLLASSLDALPRILEHLLVIFIMKCKQAF